MKKANFFQRRVIRNYLKASLRFNKMIKKMKKILEKI